MIMLLLRPSVDIPVIYQQATIAVPASLAPLL
jgi:hypothetical protein